MKEESAIAMHWRWVWTDFAAVVFVASAIHIDMDIVVCVVGLPAIEKLPANLGVFPGLYCVRRQGLKGVSYHLNSGFLTLIQSKSIDGRID